MSKIPPIIVMAGLDPAIHAIAAAAGPRSGAWMPGSSPGMTIL
jgi:hypothetical protein